MPNDKCSRRRAGEPPASKERRDALTMARLTNTEPESRHLLKVPMPGVEDGGGQRTINLNQDRVDRVTTIIKRDLWHEVKFVPPHKVSQFARDCLVNTGLANRITTKATTSLKGTS